MTPLPSAPSPEGRGASLKRVVINTCFGGFGISDAAYEKLGEWGIPIRKYEQQERDSETGLFKPQPLNEGEVIFDRDLTGAEESPLAAIYWQYRGSRVQGRYWDSWLDDSRSHPLLLRVVEELGEAANGQFAKLRIVEIPADVEYTIEEYDGLEHIAEAHRTWN